MLDLRRLRLLRELKDRGTIAAVADALQFTPSAVSQQLAVLEREVGLKLIEPAGRGVRLTDPGLVLAEHAGELLERTALAEADLAAAAGEVAGRARIASFQSAALRIVVPVIERLAREAPRLRCELVEAEPEDALPALALGDLDLVLGDEWQHQPWRLPPGLRRQELLRDPLYVLLPARHATARRHPRAVPLAELAADAWATGHVGLAWEEVTRRTCRELGGFEPDIRHRTNDATVALSLVARGHALTLLPGLVLPQRPGGIAVRAIAEGSVDRAIVAVTRQTDEARPSTRAMLAAMEEVAAGLEVATGVSSAGGRGRARSAPPKRRSGGTRRRAS